MDYQKSITPNLKKQSLHHLRNNDIVTSKPLDFGMQEQNKDQKRFLNGEQTLDESFELLKKITGQLRSNWRDSKEKLKALTYGTAFALSNKLVMTCGHNVYSEKHNVKASQIYFFPGINCDKARVKPLKCTQSHQIKLQVPKPSYSYLPTKEELTIFVLDQEDQLQQNNFFKLGQLDINDAKQHSLSIIGYPSSTYFNQHKMNDEFHQKVRMTVLEGKVHSTSNCIINHTMKTSIGISGSPIISKNKKGELIIVGIHTHKGFSSEYNSGLYFTKEILDIFKNFARQMGVTNPQSMIDQDNPNKDIQDAEKQSQKSTTCQSQNGSKSSLNNSDQNDQQDYSQNSNQSNMITGEKDNDSDSQSEYQDENQMKSVIPSDIQALGNNQDQSDMNIEQNKDSKQVSIDLQSNNQDSKNLEQISNQNLPQISQSSTQNYDVIFKIRNNGKIDKDKQSNQNINRKQPLQDEKEQFNKIYETIKISIANA